MQFKDWSEDLFIEYLSTRFSCKKDIAGIGDDCAVIPSTNGKAWLVTADCLVEGVHFLKNQITPKELGYKTVAVNVSDIAAMGGEPKYVFLSIALPKTTDCSWVKSSIDGIKEACDKWNLQLLGGDTVGSKSDIFISLTLIGSADHTKIKYRNQARKGDVICIDGYLGNSGAGLKALRTKKTDTNDLQTLIRSHFRPEPSPEQGMWLASHEEVHAMMDISDGLDCDLRRLIKKSGKGAVIETTMIPISSLLSKVCKEQDWDALEFALVGGEDYCLLLTIAPEAFERIKGAFKRKFNRNLFPIGHINNLTNQLSYYKKDEEIQINYKIYNHF